MLRRSVQPQHAESAMHAIRLTAITIAVALNFSAPAFAQQYKAGSIVIDQPWARATPAGADVGAGYMTITNSGNQPDRLIGGALPQAGTFQVHEMKMEDGVMKMREVPGGLEIKPGQKIELKPGGYHVMFMDLHSPLKQGETLKGQLRFEKAGTVDVDYKVEAVGAQGPAQHGH
jgi:copper(I)-binding protein